MNSLLLLTLFIVISIVMISLFKSIRPKIARFLSWKLSATIAGLYLGILVVHVPILYLLPKVGFIETVESKEQAISNSQKFRNDFYNQHFLSEADLTKLQGIHKNGSHTFEVDSSKLSFKLQTKTGSYYVFIERKGLDDNKIDVSTYVTAQYIGDVNFAQELAPPAITLKNGIMSLRAPSFQRMEFKQFNSDFTIAQFNHQNLTHGMSTHFGDQIVYIRVPESLKIDRDGVEDRIQLIGR